VTSLCVIPSGASPLRAAPKLRLPFAPWRRLAGAASILFALAGCVVPPKGTVNASGAGMTLTPVAFTALPGWSSAQPAGALAAFVTSCQRIQYLPPDQSLGGSGTAATLGGNAAAWSTVCSAARGTPLADDAAARAFFLAQFQPYLVAESGNSAARFTGYYEPEVAGSTTQTDAFQTPLLGLPPDLVSFDLGGFEPSLAGKTVVGRIAGDAVVPYYDRFQIDNGALDGQQLAIAWVADPVDAFFLQVEGSGRIDLPNGDTMRVVYAGKNGRPYVPIGRVMVEQKLLPPDGVSEQSIRAWLEAHPDRARAIMERNPSYVFFKTAPELPSDSGPPGALGVSLTPGRSIAVDRKYLPLGAPVWVDTTDPTTHAAYQRLMVAQDLGAAIQGPLHVDIFFGTGATASIPAGAMNAGGKVYVLLPKPAAP
jgi:membrane-bound lytic murein transglycosylase A